ncbi:hypothetical protein LA080_013639 [Diaporthe eres]|nr:hypothetical protein LA080_013639 [Diaporthe eres]
MCFSEFIGYTCGHSSPEVLRPCPMTTQFYTNPLCTQHARRPILAPEMCPACQRVIHGRAVLITEWEHRWMHERGACGCEVRFPDLIRPRVVSRSRPGQSIGRTGPTRNNTMGSKNNAASSVSLPKTERSNTAGCKGVPAHYQERSTKVGQHKLEVAVRIPSLYGAEWVDEHRQLHKDGSCKCAGDFSFYKTPEPNQSVPSSSALVENGPGQVVQTKSSSNEAAQLEPSTPSHRQEVSRATTPKPPPLVVSSSYPHVHAPQRSPGAIYDVDPTKSTNRLYNFACNEGSNMASLADFQAVEFPRAEGTLPLVGLPIGAGPEGAPDLSHVGSFEDCVLHTRNLIACMCDEPMACLLATKSKSFACLHALRAGGEEGPGEQQQAPSALERSQNASSSAEFPNYEDSSAEDQLYFS